MSALAWLRAELMRTWSRAFALVDADADGRITADELGTAFRTHGRELSETRVRAFIENVDRDGDGRLDLAEFIVLAQADGIHSPFLDRHRQLPGQPNGTQDIRIIC